MIDRFCTHNDISQRQLATIASSASQSEYNVRILFTNHLNTCHCCINLAYTTLTNNDLFVFSNIFQQAIFFLHCNKNGDFFSRLHSVR